MNKFIKSDVEQGLKYLKIGIMNALADIENGEREIILGQHVPVSLVIKCAEERGWQPWFDNPELDLYINKLDCWYNMKYQENKIIVAGSLLNGQTTKIYLSNG